MTMRRLLPLALLLSLSACSLAQLNPLNWFGGGPGGETGAEADPTVLAPSILAARAERLPGGVLIWAEGPAAGSGAWDGALVPVLDGTGAFSHFALRMRPGDGPAGADRVSAALTLSRAEASALGRVSVVSASNAVQLSLR
jgi:hypothetical protein